MRRRNLLSALLAASLAGCTGGFGVAPTPTNESDRSAAATDASDGGVRATVTHVVDGDTVKVAFSDGSRDTVRLLGIDTPELREPNSPEEYEGVPETEAGVACLDDAGETASAYAKDRLSGETVRIAFDEGADRRDYYDRLLAYVHVDGESFNRELLRRGYARLYDGTFTERERYAATERRARDAGRGLWACATPSQGIERPPTNATPGVERPY